MVFRTFYANTYKDVSAHSMSRFSVGSGSGDTVSITDSHLKKGHIAIELSDEGWHLKSKDNVFVGGIYALQAAIVPGATVGVSEDENISIFAIEDPPERPTTFRISDCEDLSIGSGADNGVVHTTSPTMMRWEI